VHDPAHFPSDHPGSAPLHRASVWRALSRALHGLCPACGLSPVFLHRFQSERRCDACGWLFERGDGHWIGGSEINMIVTFWTACPLFIAASLTLGFSWGILVLAGAFTVAFSLAIHRPSRCLFIAIDHLFDPRPDPSDDGGDGPGGPATRPGVPPPQRRVPGDGGHTSRAPF